MIVLGPEEISRLLTYDAGIPVMRDAMMKLSSGETRQMLRNILPLGGAQMFGIMAGTLGEGDAFGSKLVSVDPQRKDMTRPSHQGVVVLFDPETLAPACLAEAGMVTAIRTACASAMATGLLARSDADTLCILGTGEQARHHALAIPKVRSLKSIRIWGRSPGRAEALAADIAHETAIPTRAVATVAEAADGADIICTVTSSPDPLLLSEHVATGAHINIVGSSYDGPREIDDVLVKRARFFADSRASVLAQGAELRHAIASGLVNEDHLLGEIGEVASGGCAGRTGVADVTLYKSLGHIIQDIAATGYVLKAKKGLDG